jgi:hypothetical protein
MQTAARPATAHDQENVAPAVNPKQAAVAEAEKKKKCVLFSARSRVVGETKTPPIDPSIANTVFPISFLESLFFWNVPAGTVRAVRTFERIPLTRNLPTRTSPRRIAMRVQGMLPRNARKR